MTRATAPSSASARMDVEARHIRKASLVPAPCVIGWITTRTCDSASIIASDSSWVTGQRSGYGAAQAEASDRIINVEDRCDLTHKIETNAVARDAPFVKTLRQAFEQRRLDRELRRDFPRV